jgi:hypothetical protein
MHALNCVLSFYGGMCFVCHAAVTCRSKITARKVIRKRLQNVDGNLSSYFNHCAVSGMTPWKSIVIIITITKCRVQFTIIHE